MALPGLGGGGEAGQGRANPAALAPEAAHRSPGSCSKGSPHTLKTLKEGTFFSNQRSSTQRNGANPIALSHFVLPALGSVGRHSGGSSQQSRVNKAAAFQKHQKENSPGNWERLKKSERKQL